MRGGEEHTVGGLLLRTCAGPMRGGFSLVEVMVALVVLEVGILGVAGTLVLARRSLEHAHARERATVHLSYVFDALRENWAPGEVRGEEAWGAWGWRADADGRVEAWAAVSGDTLRVEGEVPTW